MNATVCKKCNRRYSMEFGHEPTMFCDFCAHDIAEAHHRREPFVKKVIELYREWDRTPESFDRAAFAKACSNLANWNP